MKQSRISILNNQTNTTHLDSVRELFDQVPKRAIIASPYLANNLKSILKQIAIHNCDQFDLITTFKKDDPEQITKPRQLKEAFDFINSLDKPVDFNLSIDNQLHGKVYIAVHDDRSEMIITSANLSQNGLSENHEWGIKINDSEEIEAVIEMLFDDIDYPEITETQVKRACLFADQYERDRSDQFKAPDYSDLNILEDVYNGRSEDSIEPKYFFPSFLRSRVGMHSLNSP